MWVLPALNSHCLSGGALARVESLPSMNCLSSKRHTWKIRSAGEAAKLLRKCVICSKDNLHTTLRHLLSCPSHGLILVLLDMSYHFLQDWISLSVCNYRGFCRMSYKPGQKTGPKSDAMEETFYCFQFLDSLVCLPISSVSSHASFFFY